MLRYTLTYEGKEDLILTRSDLPVNADQFKYTLTRSNTYYSVLRSFTISDKFWGRGKIWIDEVFELTGWASEIGVKVEMYDGVLMQWLPIIENGIVNLSKIRQSELYTEVNFEDGSFEQKVMNYNDTEINYYATEDIEGNPIATSEVNTVLLVLRGLVNGVVQTFEKQAVKPFNAFQRVLQAITGKPEPLFSTELKTGLFSTVLLANGRMIRGIENTSISFSLKDLFTSFNSFGCLGMGFESIEGQKQVIIEGRSYFFNQTVIATIDQLNDLEYEIADELMYNQINVGYSKTAKSESENGLSDFNRKINYTSPAKQFTKKIDIISTYSASGTDIESLRVKGFTDDSDDRDDNIFLVDTFIDPDTGNYTSRQTEGFLELDGVYENYELKTNARLSPARMLYQWGSWLSVCLKYFKEKKLKYNSQSLLSQLRTRFGVEEYTILDGSDIAISELAQPYLSGRVIKFNCTFDASTMSSIISNPNGLIKYYDYIKKDYNFAYIKELSMTAVDKKHNVELWEATTIDETEISGVILCEDGGNMLQESGFNILLEENMAQTPTKISQFDILTAIADTAYIPFVQDGKNYQISGADFKDTVINAVDGAVFVTIAAGEIKEINLGAYSNNKAYQINYYSSRGSSRMRSGMVGIMAYSDSGANLIEPGYTTSPEEDNGGYLLTSDVSSGQVRLIVTADSSDSDNTGFYYVAKKV